MSSLKRWTGTKWESISNGNYILQGGLTGSLISEQILTVDSSTVNFTGLNNLVDGDYTLECSIINSTSVVQILELYIADSNGILDTTSSNYKYSFIYSDYTSTPKSTFGASPTLPQLSAQLGSSQNLTINIKVINGYMVATYVCGEYDITGGPINVSGTIKKNSTISLLTTIQIKDLTGTGIKSGSMFKLYGSKTPTKLISYDPINFGSLTGDRLLKAGEVAYINYTSATSVPLNIATEEGVYEIETINNNMLTTPLSTGETYIKPNNNNLGSSIIRHFRHYQSYNNSWTSSGTMRTNFKIGDQLIINSKMIAYTFIGGKAINGTSTFKDTSSNYYVEINKFTWEDNTTPWTSLGTITFPFAQSGKIVIRRII